MMLFKIDFPGLGQMPRVVVRSVRKADKEQFWVCAELYNNSTGRWEDVRKALATSLPAACRSATKWAERWILRYEAGQREHEEVGLPEEKLANSLPPK